MNTVSIRSVRQVSPLFLAAAIVVLSFLQARAEVTVRARVVEIEPEARVRIFWTWGGQGLGGTPFGGEWTEVPLDTAKPLMPSTGMTSSDALDALLMPDDKSAGDVLIENGKASDYHWLAKGVWSPELPIGNLYYRTVYARGCAPGDAGKAVAIKHAVFEFEVLQDGESVAKFTEESPSGAVCTVVLPGRMVKDGKVMPGFLEHARGLYELSRWRMEWMESLPWAGEKLPRRYEIISNLSGYGTDHGYGVRTSSLKVMSHEARTMRQMGINGVRHNPRFLMDAELRERCPAIKDLTYFTMSRTGGYPFPGAPRADSTGKRPPLPWGEGVGCPWHPAHSNRVEQARKEVESKIAEYQGTPFVSSWELTVDEIGSAFDGTAEGKAHQGTCPHCTAKFREYLKDKGLIPRDFDVADWEPIRSTFGYFEKSYEQRMKEEAEGRERDRPKLMVPGEMPGVSEAQIAGLLGVEGADPAEKANAGMSRDETVVDLSDADVEAGGSAEVAKALAEDAERQGIPSSPVPEISARGWHKLGYWSRRFNSDGSAMLFTPMRDAYAAANAAKAKAIAEGRMDSPEAKQPWLFMFALRGNTFLMGGHSLDFFNFYRYSDTAFVYETSNRDPRVWQWDSHLCDVGRVVSDKMDIAFGIYVKPHRGAGMQRALSAAARGARYLYWYTYGPDWSTGDSFGGNTNTMAKVSLTARFLGEVEDVLWDGDLASPAEVAVVRPLSSEYFGNSAQWENGKWVYTALTHAHLPLDPLDEEFLLSEDLGRYKAIYISGSHIRRDVVPAIIKYVENGGTLFTDCGGMRRDESGQTIEELMPVFGLESRGDSALWGSVPRYGATSLGSVKALTNAPPDAVVKTSGDPAGFRLQVGWERLDPAAGAKVMATFGDGSPALICNEYGKGKAWIAGWYSGVEYATGVMKEGYDCSVDFPSAQRDLIAFAAVSAGARPAVDPSHPLVEGVRVRNPKTGREAVVLMNWAYRGRDLVVINELKVVIPNAGSLRGARSVAQRRNLEVVRDGATLVVDVGEMQEGDVLLLE